jgi:hypothetical protein
MWITHALIAISVETSRPSFLNVSMRAVPRTFIASRQLPKNSRKLKKHALLVPQNLLGMTGNKYIIAALV